MTFTKRLFACLMLAPLQLGASGFLDSDSPRLWVDEPQLDQFSLCFNHTCKETATVGLDRKQWQRIRDLFTPPPQSASRERQRIAQAIGLLETLVGPMIGTQNDKAMNFQGSLAQGNQQDCIDESTNATTFLTLMAQQHLLKYHQVQATSTRGWFIMGMPHTTAVIRDKASGIDYAVDSWFHDNGHPAEILPLDTWRNGWYPDKKP
jgi:hypothetical protein